MAERTASIRVDVEGADEAISRAKSVKKAFSDITKGFQEAGRAAANELGAALKGVATDAIQASITTNKISFSRGLAEARAFQESVTRLSAVSRYSVGTLDATFVQLSKTTLVPEKNIVGFTNAIRKLTYDTDGALKSFGGLADEAIATGRGSVDEMAPLGVTLHNVLGVTGDTTKALGVMRAQAEAVGQVGGPGALQDQLVGLSDVLSQIATKGKNASGEISALVSGLSKGLNKEQGERAISGILGRIESNPIGFSRYLMGKKTSDYFDEQGHMKSPITMLADMQKQFRSRYGKYAVERAQATFGLEGGAALMNADFASIAELAKTKPSGEAKAVATSVRSSAAFRGIEAQQARDRAERETAGKLAPVSNAVQGFVSEHPILGTVGAVAGTALAGQAMSALGRGTLGKVGGGVVGGVAGALGAAGAGGATRVYVTGGRLDGTASGTIVSGAAEGIGGKAMSTLGKAGWIGAAAAGGLAIGAWAGNDLLNIAARRDEKKLSDKNMDIARDIAVRDVARTSRAVNAIAGESQAAKGAPNAAAPDVAALWDLIRKMESPTFNIVTTAPGPVQVIAAHKAKQGKQ